MASRQFFDPLTLLRVAPVVSSSAALWFSHDQYFFLKVFLRIEERDKVKPVVPAYFRKFFNGGLSRLLPLYAITIGTGIANSYSRPAAAHLWYACGAAFALAHFTFVPAVMWKVEHLANEENDAKGTGAEYLKKWLDVHTIRSIVVDFPAWLVDPPAASKFHSTASPPLLSAPICDHEFWQALGVVNAAHNGVVNSPLTTATVLFDSLARLSVPFVYRILDTIGPKAIGGRSSRSLTMSEITITGWSTRDVRFPTSLDKTGSDAMNAAGDYSAAYCILETDSKYTGHGMTFTIGRGNDIVCAAINHLGDRLKGRTLSSLVENWGKTWRYLVNDSQLRWIGPEKGVIHLALGAVVNAIWDMWAKTLGKPVWQIVAEMTPEEFVRCIDFRYITDALTPEEAITMLKESEAGKAQRFQEALNSRAVPAYTTSAGWLGYGEDKMRALLQETLANGYKHFKLKVGSSVETDRRRLGIARDIIGYDKGNVLMVDANQVWSVPEAIDYMKQLADFKPWFIEEPTSPDDILGHKAVRDALKPYGIGVATGEMCQNRVVFKQLLMAGAIDVCQIDACRMGGVNEVLAVLLMAKKYNVPIVPHSGGVGLPEYTQHLSTIDYVVVSGRLSVLEYVDHLHEHFLHPSVIKDGYYQTPMDPGYSVEMKPESMDRFEFPGKEGVSWWRSDEAKPILEGEKI
ncbi:hypothetical protein DL770_005776 [Monosporascus sp. CRB-9-2]|nr:hypothetical protein DL770_005776 [Monosporascus sp. CRB-9-2]